MKGKNLLQVCPCKDCTKRYEACQDHCKLLGMYRHMCKERAKAKAFMRAQQSMQWGGMEHADRKSNGEIWKDRAGKLTRGQHAPRHDWGIEDD